MVYIEIIFKKKNIMLKYGNDENVQLTFLFFLLYAAKYGMHSLPSNIHHCKNRSIHRSFIILGTIAFTMSVYVWFDNILFYFFYILHRFVAWFHENLLFALSQMCLISIFFCECMCVCVRICIQSKCQIEMRLMVKGGTLKHKYTKCIHFPHIYALE